MKRSTWLFVGLFVLLCAVPSKADNRIIVRTTLGLSGLQQVCLLQTCSVVGGLGDPLNQLFLITTPLDATTFLNLVRVLPGIVDAELDQLLSLLGGLNVVPTTLPSGLMSDRTAVSPCGSTVWNSYASQPAATIVQVQTAQQQFCGAGVVADIDTGIDPNHPAFAGVLLPGYDFTRNQQGASELNDIDPSDFPTYPPPSCSSTTCPTAATVNQSSAAILDQSSAAILDGNVKYAAFGHGTMVMGVIHLVAPKASLLPLKAFRSDGTGYLSDVVRAIYYAAKNGANVINMSFDFTTDSQELTSALAYVNQSSVIGVASVGNNGQKEIVYPAAFQNEVMGVASTSDLDARSSFSDYGDAIVWVAAPGEAIITTYPFDTYAAGWGTSFSAPFVSGASSLLLNKQSNINFSQTAAAIAHAVPIGADMGNGRLAIEQALQASSSADFALSVSPTTSTVNAGQSAVYTVTVTPMGGFNQQVSLSCSGMPAASTCTIAPSTVTLDGTTPATVTMVVQTTARTAAAVPLFLPMGTLPWDGIRFAVYFLLYVACFALWLRIGHSRRASRYAQASPAVVGLVAVSLLLPSCTGVSGTTGTPPPSTSSADGVTISSITLNPTSITGGSSSTGTVTLDSPAPSGGAVISLSSSDTTIATVPSSLTVPAGSANAPFQISTKPVAASTSVILSASHANATTQTASLMVTPAASGASLTSLSLNPSTVIGGSSVTGVVTLSAPAPSGGAKVSLSSSNTAVATLPSNVTVPAGATGTTFTVASTTVTATTSVTISASYAGVTENNSLTVNPPPPPGTPAGTYTLTISGSGGGISHSTMTSLVVD